MKLARIHVGLLLLLTAGCQPALRPAPGMSAVQIKVIAEPKSGYRPPDGTLSTYDGPDTHTLGAYERVDYKSLEDVIVWFQPADAGAAMMPWMHITPVTIEVDPSVAAMRLADPVAGGQTVVLHNRGDKATTIYSVSNGNEFDAGTVPAGGRAEFVVKSMGLIEVLSDSSKAPIALIYATPTTWAARTRAGSTVTFNDVPPGLYEIVSWHPRLPGTGQTVELSANQVTTASIKVGVNGLPKIAPK